MTAPVYIVSDLHIGDDSKRDNFKYKRKRDKFAAFLDLIGTSELLVLGDMFEFWQADIDMVLTENQDLLARLARMNVSYIPGNHDCDMARFYKQPVSGFEAFLNHPFFREKAVRTLSRRYGGKNFIFRHGHEGDAFNDKTAPDSGRMFAIIAGMIEDRLGSRYLDARENVPLEKTLVNAGEFLLRIVERFCGKIAARSELPRTRALPPASFDANAADGGGAGDFELEVAELEELARDSVNEVLAEPEGDRMAVPANAPATMRGMDQLPSFWKKNSPNMDRHLQAMKKIYVEDSVPGMANVMIVGHTHDPGVCGDWYRNSGSWSDLGFDVLLIDNSGDVSFHTYAEGSLAPAKPREYRDTTTFRGEPS